MNTKDFGFSIIEQDAAKTLLNSISPIETGDKVNTSLTFNNKNFFDDVTIKWLPGITFNNCDFFALTLNGINGSNSYLNHSMLRNCKFQNCNLKYSNLKGTTFNNVNEKACSFDHSDFSETEIYGSKFGGCSFSNCIFYKTSIKNTSFFQTEFNNAVFIDVLFEAIDFAKASFKNAEFRGCSFENCLFPYFGILHISYGLKEILQNNTIRLKPVRTNHVVTCKEYLQEIHELLPAFFSEKDYLSMANVYILEGEMKKAYQALKNGIVYACSKKDFDLINNLSRIACFNRFSSVDLKELYYTITHNIRIEELNNVESRHYLNQLTNVKEILFDTADELNTMHITIQTNFDYKETDKLAGTIEILYKLIDLIDNKLSNKIVIRHNSPPEISVILSGDFYNLILFFATTVYILQKSTTFIEKVQNLIKNHYDIELQKLDLRKKQEEIRQLEAQKQNTSKILLPEDYASISYIMKTTPNYPNTLLCFESKSNKGIPTL